MNAIRVILVITIVFFVVDRVLYFSEFGSGYGSFTAEISGLEKSCGGVSGKQDFYINIYLNIDGAYLEINKPFIGLYPLKLCFFGDYLMLGNEGIYRLDEGDEIIVRVSADNSLYIGWWSNYISAFFIVISMLGLCLSYYIPKYNLN